MPAPSQPARRPRRGPALSADADYRTIMDAFARYVADERPCLSTPVAAADLMRPVLQTREQEEMHALLLDTRNRLLADVRLTMGLADRTQIHPREAFREAIRCKGGCTRIILIHNHPSGDPQPSPQDVAATRQLAEAGRIVGIEVLDHIVLGRRTPGRTRDHVSFREEGLLPA